METVTVAASEEALAKACQNLESEVGTALAASFLITGLSGVGGNLIGNHISPNDSKSSLSGTFAGITFAGVLIWILFVAIYRNSGRNQ